MTPTAALPELTEIAGLPALIQGPKRPAATLILAHGAGAGMEHRWMTRVADAITSAGGIRVVRFEFPYMAARREGRRPGPDREPVLRSSWHEVVEALGRPERMVIGGKSMGGRIASMVADEMGIAGVVCLGYPFHPVGRPDSLRTAHLAKLKTPALILQGERDPMGTREDVAGYTFSKKIRVQWLPDGDHSFAPRKSSGVTEVENLAMATEAVVAFVRRVTEAG